MCRVWRNYRELEFRLGSSISVHCQSSEGCRITDHPKRPRDPNQLAKSIIDIAATGEKPDRGPYARGAGQGPGCGGVAS
jgi:hypothetical protein